MFEETLELRGLDRGTINESLIADKATVIMEMILLYIARDNLHRLVAALLNKFRNDLCTLHSEAFLLYTVAYGFRTIIVKIYQSITFDYR